MLTAQNEFQILNLHHKKTYISKIKLPVFLMPKAKVKKFPPIFLSYKNNVLRLRIQYEHIRTCELGDD